MSKMEAFLNVMSLLIAAMTLIIHIKLFNKYILMTDFKFVYVNYFIL